ncbi:MAG: universal stress protein [Acidimicrobiia bacterium]|jgi:nucleotide-binding universal stress UspA family protein
MSRIVLATDGSEHALRAAETAGLLSRALDLPVDIINVVPEGTLTATQPVHEYARIENVIITQRELLQGAGAEAVAKAAARVGEAGGSVEDTEVLIGSPARQIVDYANKVGAQCIVMGRRGLGEIGGLFMGSVSHKVGHLTAVTLVTTK